MNKTLFAVILFFSINIISLLCGGQVCLRAQKKKITFLSNAKKRNDEHAFIPQSRKKAFSPNNFTWKKKKNISKAGVRKDKNGNLGKGITHRCFHIFAERKKKGEVESEHEKKEHETFLIVDGCSLLFKNFFGMPFLKNENEINLSTIYGFIQSLNKIYKLFSPTYVVIVFDSKTSNDEKKKIYAKYKILRKKNPDELYEQLKLVNEFCDVIGIKTVNSVNVESDNYIAALVDTINNTVRNKGRSATSEEETNREHTIDGEDILLRKAFRVVIVSSDKDLLQLLEYSDDAHDNLNIVVCQPNRKYRLVDAKLFFEEHNIFPSQYSDYLILAGDKTDGISGIPSIGDKTSICLLKEFGSIDNILKNLHKVPTKLHSILMNNIENINMFRKLIQLKCKTKDSLTLSDYKQNSIKNFELFQNIVDKYSLHKLLKKSIIVNYHNY
ncbi:5'-3' exonuclease N-terminal resolvase-like domain [Plasmodium ovale curtisi]|uniref:5'-3' exonuclease N-terminal resolvase-like domain n=1 Tax=Plasmodium ovale curtisi TaxID=864141 RepID=A0A1A8VR76_PLAOA|nr:5'-3' exonuclease N-terminal resolvase-like domain [Plasmodium ovale curtisi]SBS82172.1 5'-3' exonuclease N-terminal resolvase-like domain [Plasmodium ovale curtisi]